MRYHVEWPGGSCYFDADDDGEATERARDLVEDMGREADVTVLDDGRYLGVPQRTCNQPPFQIEARLQAVLRDGQKPIRRTSDRSRCFASTCVHGGV